MTQYNAILAHLKKGRPLTAIEALNRFGCFRLAARTLEIRQAGYNIVSRMVERDGKRFAEYRLVK